MNTPVPLLLITSCLALASCSSSNNSITPIGVDPEESPADALDQESPADALDQELSVNNVPNEVTYRITFDADWTAERHPVQFPGASAHFSGLVGAVHNEQVIFWEPGQIATDGIEFMAETGGKSIFLDEIDTSIANGYALSSIDGAGVSTGNGQASIDVLVTQEFSQITVTSMMAPSPDWFVGLHNFELFDGSTFIDSTTVDAVLYDSGTDSGLSYTSSNQDTNPRDPILATTSDPANSSFVYGLPTAGRFVIERL